MTSRTSTVNPPVANSFQARAFNILDLKTNRLRIPDSLRIINSYLIGALILTAGCANKRYEARRNSETRFFVTTEAELLDKYGKAAKEEDHGSGVKWLTYRFDNGVVSSGSYGHGAMRSRTVEAWCEVTFRLHDGRITGFHEKGTDCMSVR